MAAAELAFEHLALALETTHGTAVAVPTHSLNMVGRLVPSKSYGRLSRSDGTLVEYAASQETRSTDTFETDDSTLDLNTLPLLLEMVVKGGGVVTTPAGATNARLHTYTPSVTSDDLKSATVWWGDPNTQVFQSAYVMADTLTISADASSEDTPTVGLTAWGKFSSKVTAPTYPALTDAGLLNAQNMQVWLDTASAIGTTEITGRVVSTDWSIPAGTVQKFMAVGPGVTGSFSKHGRVKRHAECQIVFELTDMAQYDLFANGSKIKLRVRLNGALIEAGFYAYAQLDIYGRLEFDDWGDLEGSNRLIQFNILSEYDATAGTDFAMAVQNTLTAL